MSTPDLTPILNDLAAGRIDAAEAARRIDSLKAVADADDAVPQVGDDGRAPSGDIGSESSSDEPEGKANGEAYSPFARDVFTPPSGDDGHAGGRASKRGVERIAIRAVGRRVRIVGDSSVATASAEGPHVLRRTGSVLEVTSDGELGPSFDGFSILKPPRSLDDLKSVSLGKELYLRVNPAIAVDVEVTAGNLVCHGVPYLGKLRLTAGAADIDGARELDDVLIQAGSATVRGDITTGRSRVRCESGQVTIELTPSSNVAVHGEVQLGRLSWVPNPGGQVDEVIVGNGSAKLDVSVIMGWATIKTGEVLR